LFVDVLWVWHLFAVFKSVLHVFFNLSAFSHVAFFEIFLCFFLLPGQCRTLYCCYLMYLSPMGEAGRSPGKIFCFLNSFQFFG
jgi:hypothetical protein